MKAFDTATRAVRAAIDTDAQHGSVIPPLHLSTTHSFESFGVKRQYDYCRSGNPTRDALANALCELEGAAAATVVASGMAAVHLVGQLLKPGELVVIPHDCYGGTYRLFTHLARRGQFELAIVDQTDPLALEHALAREPKLLWIETPSNPLLRLVDIQHLCERAHARDTLVCVDNTFLSPALQQPFELGADLVIHSTTK
ncbi:MAG: aminotransferase class I/II-fold pyridoxal phosphate-dependent enzyme, partial [Pseudomonadota bacterium]